ncbi:MAG: Tat pathway signal protein, partial [Comamonadaceae bacterium]|nr:Tat pathway signal protein [Comamonadaceae bacterium]
MHFIQPQQHTRRAFLRRAGQLAFTGAALPTALNLAAMGEAAAFNATDYKALVCVFLFGGNDHANTVVPYDNASYDRYSTIRGGGADRTAGGIALGQAALAPTLLTPATPLPNGLQYALHPEMSGLAQLFNTGQAGVLLNVGPLVVPLTRADYRSGNRTLYPVPPKLFSHNDQQSVWQSSSPEGSTVGWGGKLGDLVLSSRANSNALFTCMSVTGNTVFLSGDSALSYQVSTGGAVRINSLASNVYGSSAVRTAMDQLTELGSSHLLEREYNRVTQRAIGAEGAITTALASAAAADSSTAPNPSFAAFSPTVMANNSLASQLKMVARLIAARGSLGAQRQVFFVSLGGFDMHDGLLNGHINQLGRLSRAMSAFQASMVALGMADKVTAFSASDFGRTLTSNGDGSDHGWGSHQLIVGGAVNGVAATQGRFYGSAPPVSVSDSSTDANDQWHVGQGRLLPSTSVDQYAATLGRWFGVEP